MAYIPPPENQDKNADNCNQCHHKHRHSNTCRQAKVTGQSRVICTMLCVDKTQLVLLQPDHELHLYQWHYNCNKTIATKVNRTLPESSGHKDGIPVQLKHTLLHPTNSTTLYILKFSPGHHQCSLNCKTSIW